MMIFGQIILLLGILETQGSFQAQKHLVRGQTYWYHKPGVTWATQATFQLLDIKFFACLVKNSWDLKQKKGSDFEFL